MRLKTSKERTTRASRHLATSHGVVALDVFTFATHAIHIHRNGTTIMRHDTHAWSWAICLSFTTALSWVIPFECLSGSTAAAAPVPIPVAAEEDGRDRPPPKLVRYVPKGLQKLAASAWHPVMDLLEAPRSHNFATLGELVLNYECEQGDLPPHSWWIDGTWGEVPIMAEILEWRDFTNQAQTFFNGMGTTPNDEFLPYIEQDVHVSNVAMIVHNQITGERLGMTVELAWSEANDDDSDGTTSFPLAIPNRVVEDPGHDFFDDNPYFTDYSVWCDFVLTESGQERVKESWVEACLEISPCAKGRCPNDPDKWWFWCPWAELFNDCGEVDPLSPMALALAEWDHCRDTCRHNLSKCLQGVIGISFTDIAAIMGMLITAAAALAACMLSPAVLVCIAAILAAGGLTLLWLGGKIWEVINCISDWNLCVQGCENALRRAIAEIREDVIAGQCAPPAP